MEFYLQGYVLPAGLPVNAGGLEPDFGAIMQE